MVNDLLYNIVYILFANVYFCSVRFPTNKMNLVIHLEVNKYTIILLVKKLSLKNFELCTGIENIV